MSKRKDASFPSVPGKAGLPEEYAHTLEALKERIRNERLQVTLSANAAMVLLYWDIGRHILDRQEREGWGAKVIDRLACDLSAAFPDMTGLSSRNFKFMRAFAEAFPDVEIVKQLVSQIPWGHIIRLMQKVKDPGERLWSRVSGYKSLNFNWLKFDIWKVLKSDFISSSWIGVCENGFTLKT